MTHASKEYTLVSRNLQEIVGDEELKKYLSPNAAKPFEVYWGTATTGKPHVAYFVPIIKIADMLHAGAKVTVLFADLHAYLDNMKSPWSILYHRATYYETIIKGMLEAVGVSLEQLHFVRGSEYELSRTYSEDVYKIAADTSIRDARKAGAEVVKQVSNPLISGLLYPLLQALDEEYLRVDAQFGGVDQRKIFMICERALPRLGYKKRIHLMNPMVPGLTGGKMSASEVDSKIDMLESSEGVRRKLERAACPPGQTAAEGNGVLAFMKFVIFPLVSLSSGTITIDGKTFADYADLEKAYVGGSVPGDSLKKCVFDHLEARMAVVRDKFNQPQFANLMAQAYPEEESASATDSATTSPLTNCEDEMARVVAAKLAATEAGMKSFAEDSAAVAKLLPGLDALLLAGRLKKNQTKRKCLRCLWSMTPSGLPHLGHSVPLRILAKLSRIAGVHVVILIDDIAAFLEEGGSSWDLLEARSTFAETMIRGVFRAHDGDEGALTVFRGSEYKCTGTFMLDFYRMVSLVPEQEAAICSGMSIASLQQETDDNTSSSAATSTTGLNLGSLLLPCLSLLDSFHLGSDIRLASPQQTEWRRSFSKQFLPKFDLTGQCTQPLFVSHEMLPALAADGTTAPGPMRSFVPLRDPKANASSASSCLPLIEPPPPGITASTAGILPGLKKRIRQTFCEPGKVAVNPPLDIFKLTVLPDLKENECLVLPRPAQHGGPIELPVASSKDDLASRLDDLFAREQLHSGDLKAALEQQLTQGLVHRLTASLPPLDQLSQLLEAAFPLAGKKNENKRQQQTKQKGGTKPKSDPQTKTTSAEKPTVNCTKQAEDNKKHQPRGKAPRAGKGGDLDPSFLAVQVGTITEVKPHTTSPSTHTICRVFFGKEHGEKTAVVGLPASQLHSITALFMTNLVPCRIDGVESEVKLICVQNGEDDHDVPLCVRGNPGDRLSFVSLSGRMSKRAAPSAGTLVDPEGHPGWKAFFADLIFDSTAASLTWKNSWRLSYSV